jgi:hypothetical protein
MLTATVAVGGLTNAANAVAPAPVFGAPVHVDDGFTGVAEPSLKVGPNDTYWISAPNGPGAVLGDPIHQGVTGDLVWSSADHGQTWQLHTTPEPILDGFDADVYVAKDGQIFAAGLYIGCVAVAASIDTAGTAFNNQPLACGSAVDDDREWLASAGPNLYVTFGSDAGTSPGFDIYLEHATLTPGGGVIPDANPVKLTDVDTGPDAYQWPGYLAADQTTGDVYVTWNTTGADDGTGDKVVVARRHPDGTITKTEIPAEGDTFDSFTAIDLDSAGNLYVAWNERRGGTRTDTLISYSTDHGATFSTPMVVNSTSIPTTVFPWVAAGDPGMVDVAYYGTTSTGPSPQEVGGGTKWDVYVAQSLNLFSTDPLDPPTFTEVKATPASMHTGGICTSGTGCGSSDRDLLDYFMIDVDSRGYAAIAYAEDGNTTSATIRFIGQTGGSSVYATPPAAPPA